MSTSTLTDTEIKIQLNDLWKVVFHNDDVTTMEFVVYVIMTIFDKDSIVARELMLKIHQTGFAVIETYSSYEIAYEKLLEVNKLNQQYSKQLKVTIEQ